MTVSSDREDHVRVTADGAELDAPLSQALRTVHDEGGHVDGIAMQGQWALTEYGDRDYDHPDTRPRMRGWLHLFAFFGSIAAAAVLIPVAFAQGARAGWPVAVYCLTILGLFGVSALYHRRRWSPRGWQLMKAGEPSMRFLVLA